MTFRSYLFFCFAFLFFYLFPQIKKGKGGDIQHRSGIVYQIYPVNCQVFAKADFLGFRRNVLRIRCRSKKAELPDTVVT